MKLAIDFSINSTAVAIQKDDESLKLYSFVANYKKGLRKFKVHDALSNIISVIGYEKVSGKEHDEQSLKLLNADSLSNKILSEIESDEQPSEIRIEGYSFGSKGNAFIDLITFNTFLKVKLIQRFGHVIKIIPPKTLKKKFTGNGNASKCEMLRHFFQKSSPGIQPLQQEIISLEIMKEEQEFVIPKPIDDIIDAIALLTFDS